MTDNLRYLLFWNISRVLSQGLDFSVNEDKNLTETDTSFIYCHLDKRWLYMGPFEQCFWATLKITFLLKMGNKTISEMDSVAGSHLVSHWWHHYPYHCFKTCPLYHDINTRIPYKKTLQLAYTAWANNITSSTSQEFSTEYRSSFVCIQLGRFWLLQNKDHISGLWFHT